MGRSPTQRDTVAPANRPVNACAILVHLSLVLDPDFCCSFVQVSACQVLYIYYRGYMENNAAISALGALAQTTRLDVFRLLVKHEPTGLAAGEVARQLGVPQNTMSVHLGILARAGLVIPERHSRSIIYRADLDGLRALTLFLIKDCCAGSPEMCAPLIAELTCC